MVLSQLETQLKALPAKTGVYLFKDKQGAILYIGKATNLYNRVKSYLGPPNSLSPKLQQLVIKINDIEFLTTNSEQEAILLEYNLIKKHMPRYNIRLKDDKTFPYLEIDLNNDWPSIHVTRRPYKEGSRYFGPFASASSVRKTLRLIKSIFPCRSCNKFIPGDYSQPCLNYHIHRCLGPCIGAVNKEEYDEMIRQVILFLEGKQELVLKELKHKMITASQQLQFEKAALFREQIKAVEQVIEAQKIATTVRVDQDVIALAQTKDQAYVEVFLIRSGKLTGHEHFLVDGTRDEKPRQIMTSFVKQYYASALSIPPLILLQHPIDDLITIADWLQYRRGASVKLQAPLRGAKKQLISMVAENARQGLEIYQSKQSANSKNTANTLKEVKENLDLPKIPMRIEGYDISNIQGTSAVGSMVVFERGLPKPSHYRRFKIKTVAGINDYAMIQEVLARRFKRSLQTEDNYASTPDLILVDGGKGHLHAASEILQRLDINSTTVASLAKERDEVFISGNPEPLDIPQTSPALHLLQRIRDESHRFALGYHQRLRNKESMISILDSIPGIGPKRKKALLRTLGSVQGIKEASTDELTAINGMTSKLAKSIKEYL